VSAWKPGDACKLVDLRRGIVLPGRIHSVDGRKMIVATDNGTLYRAAVDSSFVQRPTK
jgi:hypothetical protein